MPTASHDSNQDSRGPKPAENVKRHEIETLEGHHYLHWTQSKRMVEEIRAFLTGNGG